MLNTLCGNVFSLPGFKNIGGVVSVNCKVYITDFTVLHFKILRLPSCNLQIFLCLFLEKLNMPQNTPVTKAS